jgi:hypothetical protein
MSIRASTTKVPMQTTKEGLLDIPSPLKVELLFFQMLELNILALKTQN